MPSRNSSKRSSTKNRRTEFVTNVNFTEEEFIEAKTPLT
jgi:hypothetical protein